jgi:hypothetical protein
MRNIAVLGSLAAAGLAAGALGSCVSAKGATYPQTIAIVGAPASGHARVVLLRPDQRYDDASLSRIVVRIDDRVLGKLAYGGFLLADVPVGEVVLEVSADNRFFGTCKLPVRVSAGDTLYFDAAPRPANIVAGAVGVVAGGAVAGGAAATTSQVAVGAAAGGATASAAEGNVAKPCGGPYRMTPIAPAVALAHLDRLRASE